MTSADLVAAAEGSDWDRVAQCVAAGADVNTRGIDDNTALHLASLQGNEQAVRLLLDHGADPNSTDCTGRTPLSCAARSAEIALLLLNSGANVNSQDSRGYTPLHWAAGEGNVELVKLLMDHGADLTARTKRGQSAADIAHAWKMRPVIELMRHHRNGQEFSIRH